MSANNDTVRIKHRVCHTSSTVIAVEMRLSTASVHFGSALTIGIAAFPLVIVVILLMGLLFIYFFRQWLQNRLWFFIFETLFDHLL